MGLKSRKNSSCSNKKSVAGAEKKLLCSTKKTGSAALKKTGAEPAVAEAAPEASKRGFNGAPRVSWGTTSNQSSSFSLNCSTISRTDLPASVASCIELIFSWCWFKVFCA